MLEVYVDGSSRGNPGDGGYGIIIFDGEDSSNIIYARSAQYPNVTNNRMELLALLHALDYIEEKYPDEEVKIYSDSTYVVNSWNSWMSNWVQNGWRNSKKQQVENVDLMKALWDYCRRDFFHCSVNLCRGHDGVMGNEFADMLARGQTARFYNYALDEGYRIEDWEQNDFITRIVDYT